jgi:hypothetical protein
LPTLDITEWSNAEEPHLYENAAGEMHFSIAGEQVHNIHNKDAGEFARGSVSDEHIVVCHYEVGWAAIAKVVHAPCPLDKG